MRRKTFEKLVWALVQEDREKVLVVDNHHAYGIIKDRVDSFWEQVRLLQPDEDQLMVLGGLVALSAYAQLAAENLSLVPEQQCRDESADAAEDAADLARRRFCELIMRLDSSKKPIPELQRGTARFAFEFDEHTLEAWRTQAMELE